MNLFYIESSPRGAAQALCDKHVPKMTLETAQMLSTAVHRHLSPPNATVFPHIYRPAYLHHPSTQWVGENLSQYVWAYALFRALCDEFEFRFGKPHKSSALVHYLGSFEVITQIPKGEFDAPPQCMPKQYHHIDTMKAYRDYYRGDKMYFAKWERGREAPAWVYDA